MKLTLKGVITAELMRQGGTLDENLYYVVLPHGRFIDVEALAKCIEKHLKQRETKDSK